MPKNKWLLISNIDKYRVQGKIGDSQFLGCARGSRRHSSGGGVVGNDGVHDNRA